MCQDSDTCGSPPTVVYLNELLKNCISNMRLCTSRLHQLVRQLHYLSWNESGQRGIVYPSLTQIEMIHGQSSFGKLICIHLVHVSQLFSLRRKLFSPLVPGIINKEKMQTEKQKAKSVQHIHETARPRQKVTVSSSPARVKLLVLLGTRCDHPSLLLAHRQSRNS